jgi:alpha-N-arabinofuranosidase
VQVKRPGQGLAQWTYLPLHRVRKFEFEVFARSPDPLNLSISLTPFGAGNAPVSASIRGLSERWHKFTGVLELDTASPSEAVYKLSLTADAPGQFVIQHVFLQPADNVSGADPDIVRLLRESHLPLLRWPGGNFVSSYHWQDGVGPLEKRPAYPNYAWGGVEPNLFGTDEFIKFCRAVGCEPMICINAGNGTPEEAAQWVEYCNGSTGSSMGKWRAAHGHSKPYNVKYWEVGNELWGKWQVNWTTPAGYVDRYRQFVSAMSRTDPTIQLFACGAPVFSDRSWNDTLIHSAASQLRCITDHPLLGGTVSPTNDPLDVYRDFVALPEVLESKWSALRDEMHKAGIKEPHLAVTELQLFAHLGPNPDPNTPARVTRENLPSQASITEAIYDVLIYHAAIRLSPFVELITHSAIVNHGGGLHKERERVFANPCHYAQADFASFANAVPVPVDIISSTLVAPRVIGDLKHHVAQASYSAIDALAAIATNGNLLISIVNRDTKPIRLTTELDSFNAAGNVHEWKLQGAAPWAANTLDNPDAIEPQISVVQVHQGKLELSLEPFSIVQLSIAPSR